MTIEYEFRWDELSDELLGAISSELDLGEATAAQAIEAQFGPVPTPEFVAACVLPLVEHWLLLDSGFLEDLKTMCGYEGLVTRDPRQFADQLSRNVSGCRATSQRLLLNGLANVGSPFDGQEGPWNAESARDLPDAWIMEQMRGLREQLLVDEEWVVVDGPNWTWWPTATPIHFSVGQPKLVAGDVTYRVTARCQLVDEVGLDEAEILAHLSQWNRNASMFALVYEPESNSIDAISAFSAHQDNQPMWKLHSAAVVLVACLSTARHSMAGEFLGRPVEVPHPTSGLRTDVDDLTNFVGNVVVPEGVKKRFGAAASCVDFQQLPGCALQLENDVDAAQAEFSFLHNLPAILTRDLTWPLGTALVQFFGDGQDPVYGSGLSIKYSVPNIPMLPPNAPMFLANSLNGMEGRNETGFTFMGAWWSQPAERMGDHDLYFSQFIPSCLFNEGIAPWAAWTIALRNWWLAEWIDEIALVDEEDA